MKYRLKRVDVVNKMSGGSESRKARYEAHRGYDITRDGDTVVVVPRPPNRGEAFLVPWTQVMQAQPLHLEDVLPTRRKPGPKPRGEQDGQG